MSIDKGEAHYDDSPACQAVKIDSSRDAWIVPVYEKLEKSEKLSPQTMIGLGLEDRKVYGCLKLNTLEFAMRQKMNKSELQRHKSISYECIISLSNYHNSKNLLEKKAYGVNVEYGVLEDASDKEAYGRQRPGF